jgi:hypothetical protein
MSIRKRRPRAYQVRVSGYPARTAPTREVAERIELDLKRRRTLGVYETTSVTLGDAIDRTLARVAATRSIRTRRASTRCDQPSSGLRSEASRLVRCEGRGSRT